MTIVNPSFETGDLSGWENNSSPIGGASVVSSEKHYGTYSCKLHPTTPYGSGYIIQAVSLSEETVSLSIWYKLEEISGNAQFSIGIYDDDEGYDSIGITETCDWTEHVFDVTGWNLDAITIDIQTWGGGSSVTAYIDDVSSAGDTPSIISITEQPTDIKYPNLSISEFEVSGASCEDNVILIWNDAASQDFGPLDMGIYQATRELPELGEYYYSIYIGETLATSSDVFEYYSNVLINGDFDSAPPQGWVCAIEGTHFTGYDGGEISSLIIGASGISGSSCGELTVINPGTPYGKAEIYQYIDTSYRDSISFYYKAPIFYRVNTDTTVSIMASLGASYEYTVTTLSATGSHPIADWTQYTIDLSDIPPDTYKFSIYALVTTNLGYYPGSKAQVYIDDIEISDKMLFLNTSLVFSHTITDCGEWGIERSVTDMGNKIMNHLTDVGHYIPQIIGSYYPSITNVLRLYTFIHGRLRKIKA